VFVAGLVLTKTVASQTKEKVIVQTEWAADYLKFRDESCEAFLEKSRKVNEEYKILSYSRWDFTQESRQIVFSDKGVKKLIADVQVAGDWSPRSGTWMWGWNNSSLDRPLTKELEKVKALGQEKKWFELTKPVFAIDSDYAWTLTAVAGQIIGAKTAYRGPDDGGYIYFLITDLKWVK